LIANAVVIAWALYDKYDADLLVWVYWCQSVIIGIFWFLRIATHKKLYSLDKLAVDGRPTPLAVTDRFGLGFLFLFSYAVFHIAILPLVAAGLLSGTQEVSFPVIELAVGSCVFFVAELISFVKDPNRTQDRVADTAVLMGYPYGRIVPMHVTILIGAWVYDHGVSGQWVLAVFLVLKTIADMGGQNYLQEGFSSQELATALAKRRESEGGGQSRGTGGEETDAGT
jgi:hypothetical protein